MSSLLVMVTQTLQFKAEEAAALAAAEESGDELTTELRKSVWRYSVLGLAMGGGSLEDAEHDVKNNVLNFDGESRPSTMRKTKHHVKAIVLNFGWV
jgi:hypothetical protein